MGQTDRAAGLVDVLPPRAASPIGILANFRFGNIDHNLVLNLRRYIHGSEARLTLSF